MKLILDLNSNSFVKRELEEVEGIDFFALEDVIEECLMIERLFELVREGVLNSPNNNSFVTLEFFRDNLFVKYYKPYSKSIFMARHGEEWIGLCCLRADGSRIAYSALTTVKPKWQRRGIGRQLKLRSLQFALFHGIDQIVVENHIENAAMINLNLELGFKIETDIYATKD